MPCQSGVLQQCCLTNQPKTQWFTDINISFWLPRLQISWGLVDLGPRLRLGPGLLQVSLNLLGPLGHLGHVHLMAGAQEASAPSALPHHGMLCLKTIGQIKSRDQSQHPCGGDGPAHEGGEEGVNFCQTKIYHIIYTVVPPHQGVLVLGACCEYQNPRTPKWHSVCI